jgi:hypothetical protein
MKLLAAALFVTGCILAQATPQLVFTKSFPGSVPPYVSLKIDSTGSFTYSESAADPKPLQQGKLKEGDTAELFDLARKLGYFKSPIESGLKVANTGKKTFRYVDETGNASETSFNYSIDESAKMLLDRVEQIAASERAYLELDRCVHFDHLGINDSLAEIESLWLRKQLAAPEQFIPLLTRISNHEAFMHLVRERSARLKAEFTAPPPANTADRTK